MCKFTEFYIYILIISLPQSNAQTLGFCQTLLSFILCYKTLWSKSKHDLIIGSEDDVNLMHDSNFEQDIT